MSEREDPLHAKPLSRRHKVTMIWTLITTSWAVTLLITVFALGLADSLWGEKPPDIGALATLLFAASSLALVMFSVLIAAAAFIGWESLKKSVQGEIERNLQPRIAALELGAQEKFSGLEAELHGRVATAIGFMIGTLHSNPGSLNQKTKDKAFLSEAVRYSEKGYEKLKDIDGTIRYWALNNLLYYRCLWGEQLRQRQVVELLDQAKLLKTFAEKHDVAPYLLTYCRVVCQLSDSRSDLEEALGVVSGLPQPPGKLLTDLERREAALYEREIRRRLVEEFDAAS